MENNTGIQETTAAEEKTFTQEEVNNIVRDRLARVKAESTPDPREQELQQREEALFMRELVADKKLPQDVADALKGLDKDKINSIIDVMSPYFALKNEPILNPTGPVNTVQNTKVAELSQIRAAMGLKG